MEKRRAHGAGTIRERKPGVWELRAFVGTDPLTRRPRQVSRTFKGGKRDAERALTALKAEVAEGKYGGTVSGTFGYLLDQWLDQLTARGRRQTTVGGYRQNVEKHIRPALGHIRLKDLGPNDLDRLYTAKQAEGLSPNTIRQIHAAISAACTQGVKWRWLAVNPATQATPPAKVKTERPVPSASQVEAVLVKAADQPPELMAVVILGAMIGARRGELCGLRWSDVDWKAGSIVIERARVPVIGGHIIVPPKGNRSRTVPLQRATLDWLANYRQIQEDRCREYGATWSEDGWLCSIDGGTTPLNPKAVSTYVSTLARSAGLQTGVVLHSLRHFLVTQLISAGYDPRTVADIVGHSRTSITLDIYSRALPERTREASNHMAGLLALPAAGPGTSG